MKSFSSALILALALAVAALALHPAYARETQASLDFLSKPVLIECEAEGAEPCFRMKFDFVDDTGKPINLRLPSAGQLASHIEIQVDDQTLKPFYAAVIGNSSSQVRQPQITLLLFDISGSMLTTDFGGQSRFEAAKGAAAEYLKDFADGQDLVAIVPFASRDVEKTIAAARFVNTQAAAQAELDTLPAPQSRNNTALYSAVRAAVETLRQQQRADNVQERLILLTDGKNDVQPRSGDDKGLLGGPDGLAAAAAAVQQSGIDVLPIGLGDRRSIDEVAMARLGTRPPLITFDLETLHKAFQIQQTSQDGSIQVTVQAPASLGSRALLAGRVIHFRAKLSLPDGSILVENRQALWVAPPVATPPFEAEATEQEQRAFLTNARVDRGNFLIFLRPFIIFAGFATLLAILWFGLPRMLWPERYDARSARPVRAEYWPGGERTSRRNDPPAVRSAPPGFENAGRGARAPLRSPGERTIVQPVTGFDSEKTRLT